MNKLIKEICKREAGKSEVSVGNVRSVLKHLAEITLEHDNLKEEFETYVNKKEIDRMLKLCGVKKKVRKK